MSAYTLSHTSKSIILTKAFSRSAGILGSTAYNTLKQLRADYPDYVIEMRTIKRTEGKTNASYNLTYKNMEAYIIESDGEDSEALIEFKKMRILSKTQSGPYAYVKKWFLKKYPDSHKPVANA